MLVCGLGFKVGSIALGRVDFEDYCEEISYLL